LQLARFRWHLFKGKDFDKALKDLVSEMKVKCETQGQKHEDASNDSKESGWFVNILHL
jgi:hypothetical protein